MGEAAWDHNWLESPSHIKTGSRNQGTPWVRERGRFTKSVMQGADRGGAGVKYLYQTRDPRGAVGRQKVKREK